MRWRDIYHLKDYRNDDITVFFGNYADFTAQDADLLSEEEKIKASAFSHVRGRHHYLAGQAFLRRTLGHMLNSVPYQGVLAKDKFGKPYVVNDKPSIHFNVSHTGNTIAIAFSFMKPIGIDIEFKHRAIPRHLVDHILTKEEVREVFSEDDWREYFLRVWIRKEAVLKCIGCGFLGNAREIKISLKDEGLLACKYSSNNKYFQVWHFSPIDYTNDIICVIAV